MHRFLSDLAGRSVPRYTSYPTAAEFHGGIGAPDHAAALAAVEPDTAISLYVHIPYCHAICWYCGCNTGMAGRTERVDAYLTALRGEIADVAARTRGRVVAVHFGGGSPNALSPAQLCDLSDLLRSAFRFAPQAQWAIELDPRFIDKPFADAVGAAGFSRASLGVQTFAHRLQARINRYQSYRTVAGGVVQLAAAGVRHVNFDLMYGLPGQTLDDIAATVSQALTLRPDRIAMFGYAHLPQMLPRQRMIDAALLPDAEARFWQSALAHDLLVDAGYAAIGFDHFALPGDSLTIAARQGQLRRNFQGFTDDPAEYLVGLGASAISALPGLLVQNEKHVGSYRMRAINGMLAGTRGTFVNAEDRLRGAVIERLLCDGAVDLQEVAARHRFDPHCLTDALPSLAPLAGRGLLTITGARIELSSWATPYARIVASAFDAHRTAGGGQFSRAV